MSENKQPNTQVAQTSKNFQESTVNQVLSKIQAFQTNGELRIPKDYSPENALKSAWLILLETKDRNDKPVLESCSKESIANALLDMVIKGLSPLKKQCYFIAYGSSLKCDESYLGTIAVAKRDGEVKDANANIIYEGDVFEYTIDPKTARKSVVKHEQALENINMEKIKGAYAIVEYNDGSIKSEIMTMAQIKQAWCQGPMKGNSPAHRNFPDQMAIKTVISRALKIDIGSSDDAALNLPDPILSGVRGEIKDRANKAEIGFDTPAAEVVDSKLIESKEAKAEANGQTSAPF